MMMMMMMLFSCSDPCIPNLCENDGECIAEKKAFRCECKFGFLGRKCDKREWHSDNVRST